MKQSKYNVSIKNNNGNYIVYNTFTTSMVQFDTESYKRFTEFGLSEKETEELFQMGFLVNDNENELFHQKLLRANASFQDYGKVAGLFIAPTMACNARCYYCFEKNVKPKTMGRETIEATKRFILKNHVTDRPLWIDWFGGEPTLAIDTILEISDFLFENKVDFISYMTSNTYLLNNDMLKKIKDRINLKHLQITVDALEEEYNQIKNFTYHNANPFEVVMKNIGDILTLSDIAVSIRINFNLNNISQAEKTLDYLNNRFGMYPNINFYIAPINGEGFPVVFDDFKGENPMLTLTKKILFIGANNALKTKIDYDKYQYSLMTPIASHCAATRIHTYSIDADGLLYKCHRQLGQGKQVAVGNVFSGIEYNSNYTFWCNGDLPYKECEDCKLLPCCQGGCRMELLSKNEKSRCCRFYKQYMEQLISYLNELDG